MIPEYKIHLTFFDGRAGEIQTNHTIFVTPSPNPESPGLIISDCDKLDFENIKELTIKSIP